MRAPRYWSALVIAATGIALLGACSANPPEPDAGASPGGSLSTPVASPTPAPTLTPDIPTIPILLWSPVDLGGATLQRPSDWKPLKLPGAQKAWRLPSGGELGVTRISPTPQQITDAYLAQLVHAANANTSNPISFTLIDRRDKNNGYLVGQDSSGKSFHTWVFTNPKGGAFVATLGPRGLKSVTLEDVGGADAFAAKNSGKQE